jgi:hypothetical protein
MLVAGPDIFDDFCHFGRLIFKNMLEINQSEAFINQLFSDLILEICGKSQNN